VDQEVAKKEQKHLALIAEQKKEIEKLRNQKACLCKNIQDLQDRLKDTRLELKNTQDSLLLLQKTLREIDPDSFREPSPLEKEESLGLRGSEEGSGSQKSRKRSNKVMNYIPD
jgi:uncharacterized coiled-coil protein SlyX